MVRAERENLLEFSKALFAMKCVATILPLTKSALTLSKNTVVEEVDDVEGDGNEEEDEVKLKFVDNTHQRIPEWNERSALNGNL